MSVTRHNLERLLSPRHAAFIGGEDAMHAAVRCAQGGFSGEIWGVNPRRTTLGDFPCFRSVGDLPAPPDAVFLAVPSATAVDVVAQLAALGAGGVVCYTAGFRELGGAGAELEKVLAKVAGDLALVGPNVFGLLNYVSGAHLWPYAHGGKRVERGVALVSQSGMFSGYVTTNQRSVAFSYVIGSGNQTCLGVEDYLEALVHNPAVNAFGLYVEALRDISRFAEVAIEALARNKPIVVLKGGVSEVGASSTVTHTGSLAGTDAFYQALFDRLGIVRVATPSQMLETLKLLTVAGAPNGKKLAAFTCSGGDAAMVADGGSLLGLEFPRVSLSARNTLNELLPPIASVSNPLDYTTPLWGKEQALTQVFDALVRDDCDMALLVQDYPPLDMAHDVAMYRTDARAFAAATAAAGVPAAVCSVLAENFDAESRSLMSQQGVAPLQGLGDALMAINASTNIKKRRQCIVSNRDALRLPPVQAINGTPLAVDEWHGKQLLSAAGIEVPRGHCVGLDAVEDAADALGYPVVVKFIGIGFEHKTDLGAVRVGLENRAAVSHALVEMVSSIGKTAPSLVVDQVLVEEMIHAPVAELLVGVQSDPQFGQALTLASGGTLVELVRDSQTLLLPSSRTDIEQALMSLRCSALLQGYRGQGAVDIAALIDVLYAVTVFSEPYRSRGLELDINPLFVLKDGPVAADVLLRLIPD